MSHNIATFSGTERLVVLDPGVINFDVQDLYSDWKEFTVSGSNLKFAPAFRTIGGDPLSVGIDAGAYFFLQNQVSGTSTGNWRLKPAEADATVSIAGNLVAQDSTLPLAIPTAGDFTVLLLGLQPITQNVDTILTEVQDAAYGDAVTIDTTNGEAGTSFPVGTPTNPVNNIADARTIADSKNLKEFRLRSAITLDQNYDDWVFEGFTANAAVNLNSKSINNTIFRSCDVLGNSGGGRFRVEMSQFFCVTAFKGDVFDSLLTGSISLAVTSSPTNFVDCKSGTPGITTPIIDFVGPGRDLGIRGYSGGVELRNISGPTDAVSVDMLSGLTVLDSTCISGTVVIRGVGQLTDQSSGTLVVASGLVSLPAIADTVWDQPTTAITASGSIGEVVSTKLLTVAKFLGLK